MVIHFFENKTNVLTQLSQQIPTVDENIKIKGRKGKVLSIEEISEKVIHVYIEFEKIKKVQVSAKDNKTKRR
ncbi:hypothetical protein [Neobacillus mesonae]|uniref:hypothetical protein n=1 Tax=Neobacillus mesonae TaxID=1193713 RepID=UPI00203DD91B|nr:hypothetical protein [Neobacillus mesonae]MCM3567635.1 hypothetical protein [Neobacillus mesonae]